MDKKMITSFVIILLFLLLISAYFYKTISVNSNSVELVAIEIKGAVRSPGTYYIEKGSPVSVVFNECGGILDNASLPKDFDYNAPMYDDYSIFVSRQYYLRKNKYE